jgi:hypothetical protein
VGGGGEREQSSLRRRREVAEGAKGGGHESRRRSAFAGGLAQDAEGDELKGEEGHKDVGKGGRGAFVYQMRSDMYDSTVGPVVPLSAAAYITLKLLGWQLQVQRHSSTSMRADI